ncbi:unnamed protein product [Dibothriocephalus latus]|uniref:Uncharacterized protein n=1 Tax=Dibothriocephalus latus TaxID=60516 RepID=A0A3P7NLE7_DIBLA|nr:unnamed protein product [Dibothriocephalus latus]
MRRQSFEPRSAKVAFFAAHDGYSYVVEELEPNTIYDVQINAYYEKTLNLESNWETTSCHTAMQTFLLRKCNTVAFVARLGCQSFFTLNCIFCVFML